MTHGNNGFLLYLLMHLLPIYPPSQNQLILTAKASPESVTSFSSWFSFQSSGYSVCVSPTWWFMQAGLCIWWSSLVHCCPKLTALQLLATNVTREGTWHRSTSFVVAFVVMSSCSTLSPITMSIAHPLQWGLHLGMAITCPLTLELLYAGHTELSRCTPHRQWHLDLSSFWFIHHVSFV